MAGASFKMDMKGIKRGVQGAISHFSATQRLAATIGEAMVSSTRDRFKDETGPDGKTWPKSRRAAEEGGQTLSDTARLRNSIGYEATPETVAWGTNVEYAAAHQAGAEIVPKQKKFLKFKAPGGGDVFAKKVTLPARPFLGFTDEDREETRHIMRDFMQEGFRKGR